MSAVLEQTPHLAASVAESAKASSWLQVAVDLDPRFGGMSTAVPELAAALQNRLNISVPIAALCRDTERYVPTQLGAQSIHFLPRSHRSWAFNAKAQALLDELVQQAKGVHIHGLWTAASVMASRAAQRRARPYCIAAHGMLEPWALQQRRMQKQVYGALVEHRVLRGAACLHALTLAEAASYRQITRMVPIAVVPNGVAVPNGVSAAPFHEAFPQLRGKRIILFLGRLHAKKGVPLLLRAWPDIARRFPDTHLVLAGPADRAMLTSLQKIVTGNAMSGSVTFAGMLGPALKWSALVTSEIFILPSHSEGFSVAILEALGVGTPVIATPQCNMPQLRTEACGWLTEPGVAAIGASLRDALERTPRENALAGERGRRLIEREYTWDVIAQRVAEVYCWLAGGPVPTHAEVLR